MPEEIQAAFFKIIVDPLSESLRIPTNFTRRYGNDLPDTVSLKVPRSSKLWEIDLIRADDGEIWLDHGWKEFRDHYSMQFGHLLFFQFDAESSKFDVWIFDMTATQIDYPLDQDDSAVFLEKVYEEQNGKNEESVPEREEDPCVAKKWSFTRELKKRNAYKLVLPKKFAVNTGIATSKKITQKDAKGRKWPIRVGDSCGEIAMGSGWNAFLVANKVVVGSTLLFRFDSCSKMMIVQIVKEGIDEIALFDLKAKKAFEEES